MFKFAKGLAPGRPGLIKTLPGPSLHEWTWMGVPEVPSQLHTGCPVLSSLKGTGLGRGLGMKTPPAPTSGWKAWQASGRRRSFWERILSHLTEVLCAEVTVKVNTAEAEMTLEPVCVTVSQSCSTLRPQGL